MREIRESVMIDLWKLFVEKCVVELLVFTEASIKVQTFRTAHETQGKGSRLLEVEKRCT